MLEFLGKKSQMTVLHYRCFTIFTAGRPAERARSLSQLQAVLYDPNSALCNKEKGERLRCYVAAKDTYGPQRSILYTDGVLPGSAMDFVRDCRLVIGSLNSQSLAGNREQIHSRAEGRNPFYILLWFFLQLVVYSL